MSQRNTTVTKTAEDWPYRLTYPTQQEIDAYVREAQRMRAEAVGNLLRGFWRALTGRSKRPAGYPAKA